MSLTKIKLNFNFNLICLVFFIIMDLKIKKKYKKIKQNAKDLHLDLEKGDKRKKMMQKL